MSLFSRPPYISETTDFLQQLKAQKPALEAEQRRGRALWWDKHPNRQEQNEFNAARVAQKPYVYLTQAPK
ncbi:MAG: DUF3460 family protein [Betaproteobacteria bacterium]|jgi:hypothetical protein|nr:DUF3460 family protein [Betaproteobacteria bacterium]